MDDHRIVTHIRVVVHTLGPMGPQSQQSDNHWSIYLLVGSNQSVRINMAAKPGYVTGNLEINKYNYILTNSAVKHWDYETVGGLAVSHIVKLIYDYRRHLYNMSGGGSGCRYWVWVILSDLAAKGWLKDRTSPNQLWPVLLFRYSRTGAQTPLAMVQGEFVNE